MKKIGVTGGAGFIGSHVLDVLTELGYEVIVLDHSSPGLVTEQKLHSGVEFFQGDVRDATTVTEFAAHVDGIIHLAAVLGTQETIGNPRPSAETNILGGLNVFEAANQYSLPVVYAGVGNHWMRNFGGGTYTITKSTVEDFAKMFNKFRGGNISVVRPVNAYGPRQSVAAPYGSSKVRKIMPSFICRALVNDPIEVYGDGTQISDCVYVVDVAHSFVAALETTYRTGAVQEAVEVGPTTSCSVTEVAELVKTFAKSDSEIRYLPMRPGEVPNAVVAADVSTLEQIRLDALYFTPLASGVEHTVDWYRREWLPGYLGQ